MPFTHLVRLFIFLTTAIVRHLWVAVAMTHDRDSLRKKRMCLETVSDGLCAPWRRAAGGAVWFLVVDARGRGCSHHAGPGSREHTAGAMSQV